jgi:hypothetical protein
MNLTDKNDKATAAASLKILALLETLGVITAVVTPTVNIDNIAEEQGGIGIKEAK